MLSTSPSLGESLQKICLNSDGKYLVAASDRGNIFVYNFQSLLFGKKIFQKVCTPGKAIYALAYDPNNFDQLYFSGASQAIYGYDITTCDYKILYQHKDSIYAILCKSNK